MWRIRQASIDDLESLVQLRLQFLAEMSKLDSYTEFGKVNPDVEQAIRDYLSRNISTGVFRAWVAETEDEMVATSGLVFCQKPPHGENLTGLEGYVMNVYTKPDWRRQGIAQALLETIIDFVRTTSASCIRLHTSDEGEGIYWKLGFKRVETEMLLKL